MEEERVVVHFCATLLNVAHFCATLEKEMTELELKELIEAATELLQEDLDNHGHGLVEEWCPEMEEELGWGETCAAVRLGRALAKYRSETVSESKEKK